MSQIYERLSLAISGDETVLALLEAVPAPKRQPNLLLGVVRLLGGPVDDPAAFHERRPRGRAGPASASPALFETVAMGKRKSARTRDAETTARKMQVEGRPVWEALDLCGCPAVSYSPTLSRVQYHRRWRA
jgi:hypothetical protein